SGKLQTCTKHLIFEIFVQLIGSRVKQEVAWKVKDLWMMTSKLSALELLIVAIRVPGTALEICHQWLDCLFGSVVAATDGYLKELELDFRWLDIDRLPDLYKEIHGLASTFPIAGLIPRNPDLETMSLLRCADPLQDRCPTFSAIGLFTFLAEGATGTPQAKGCAPSRPASLHAPSFLHLRNLHLMCALDILTTSHPSPALIQFLCSFSGLKELTILHIASEDESTYSTLVHEFFIDELPNHSSTLKKPTLDAGGMRILSDRTYSEAIWSNVTLPVLTYLAITPRLKETESMLQTRYQDILDVIEAYFPNVRDLPRTLSSTLSRTLGRYLGTLQFCMGGTSRFSGWSWKDASGPVEDGSL
ncbi:hypothetical protein AX16_009037, partial [Volvariella volvacea WC 439]